MHAILGNHDWWEDRTAQRTGKGPVFGQVALENVGIRVYENDAAKLAKNGQAFWLAGLGDQLAQAGGIGLADMLERQLGGNASGGGVT